MLEGLDEVPWRELHHAYGTAEDVPALIRALLSPDADERGRALGELYGNIWHQHTVYEATPYAVPFLVDVASSDDVPDETRADVTTLLADIADGSSYVDVHQPLFDEMGVDPGFEPGQLENELAWVHASREAVRAALPRLTADLDPQAPPFRRAAAVYVASMFRDEADSLAARVQAVRDAADDPSLRRGATIALGLLGIEPLDGYDVVETDARGRPEVLRTRGDDDEDTALASTVLSDVLFSRDDDQEEERGLSRPSLLRWLFGGLLRE